MGLREPIRYKGTYRRGSLHGEGGRAPKLWGGAKADMKRCNENKEGIYKKREMIDI